MRFADKWDNKTRIELLERWILVQSYVYYELNENLSSDSDYDSNVNTLFELKRSDPKAYNASRYAHIFDGMEEGCTSGFELVQKMKKIDKELWNTVFRDALMAIELKNRRIR